MNRTIGAGGSPMTRPLLRAVMVLGVIVTLVSGTGLFAVFSDRATTGQNEISTGELGRAADLKLAAATVDDQSFTFACGPFVDDLATGLFSYTNLTPGGGTSPAAVCLKNTGTAAVDVSVTAIDLTDTDVDCTGDEAGFGDTTCGGDQVGELAATLVVNVTQFECGGLMYGSSSAQLDALPGAPISLPNSMGPTLPPNVSMCLLIQVSTNATNEAKQVSQSDKVQWRFAFDGTVPSA